jgi:hypothetical protein
MTDTHVESAEGRPPDGRLPVRRRGTWRRSLTAIVSLTMLATAVAVVGTASSAFALPTNCSTTVGAGYADSLCTGGTGEHRVALTQRSHNPMTGYFTCHGPWVPVGTVSRTTCAQHIIISARSETRESTDPGMGGQPTPPPTVPPPPGGGLDCRIIGNAMQTYIEPFHMKAMWFAFYVEYCYNSARDLARVIPHILPPLIQLPAEEVARGVSVGWIGTITINSIVSGLPVITQNDSPVRTSQGHVYTGVYTVNATFTPNLGAAIPKPQIAQATIGVIINADRGFPTPPVFIRLT